MKMQPGSLPHLSHMGIYVYDLERMTRFYAEVFGLKISDRGAGANCQLVFLSSTPTQHHQLVLASGRPAHATTSTVLQMSFMVPGLNDLRRIRRDALALGASQMCGANHGNALSIYFNDPEGNTIESYLDTPFYVAQPHRDPLDLDQSDETIWAQTERLCRADPTFATREDWEATFVNS